MQHQNTMQHYQICANTLKSICSVTYAAMDVVISLSKCAKSYNLKLIAFPEISLSSLVFYELCLMKEP